jgi:tripartite-type tricarboxylate transporter receptor subunit TctC
VRADDPERPQCQGDLSALLKDPELIKRQEALGLTVISDSRLEPDGHRQFVQAEMTRWGKVIKQAGEYAD